MKMSLSYRKVLIWVALFQLSIVNLQGTDVNNDTKDGPLTDVKDAVDHSVVVEAKTENGSVSSILPEVLIQENSGNATSIFSNGLNMGAMLRGFYVVLSLGIIFLIFMVIKTIRLRRHRATNRYRVIATKGEDRESFFPLASEEGEGEEEEIFNAASHQGYT